MARKEIIHFGNEKEMINGVAKLIDKMVREGGQKAEKMLENFSVDVNGVGYKIDDREMQKEVEEFVKKHHQAVLDAKTKITKDNRLLQESIDTIRNNEGSIAMPSVNADDIKRMEADNKKLGKLLAMREKILKDIRDYDAESDSKKKKAMLPSYNNALVQLKELEKLGKEYNKNNTVKFKIDYEGVDVKKIKRDTRNLYKEILNPDTMGTDKDIATKMEGSVNDLYDNLVEEIIKGSSELQSKLRKSIKKSVREATGSILSDTETKELAKQMMSGFDVGDIKGFKELEGKTDSLEKQLQDSIEEINKLKSELKGVTGEEFNDLKTNVSDLKTKFGELKNSLKEVNDILSGKSDNKFLDQLMADVTENISKIDELESKLKTIDNVNSDNTAGLNSLFNSQADIKDEISAIKSSFDNVFTKAREEIGKVKAELDGVTNERFSGLTEGVNSLSSEFTELNRIIHLVIDEINNINTALDSTKKDATVVNSGNRVLQDLKSEAEQADKTKQEIRELTDALNVISTSDKINDEIQSLQRLQNQIKEVIETVNKKTTAFLEESDMVELAVNSETEKLNTLNSSINEIKDNVKSINVKDLSATGISTGINELVKSLSRLKKSLKSTKSIRNFVNDLEALNKKGEALNKFANNIRKSSDAVKRATKKGISGNGLKLEVEKLENMQSLLKDVIETVKDKTEAFGAEKTSVVNSLDIEVSKLKEMLQTVNGINRSIKDSNFKDGVYSSLIANIEMLGEAIVKFEARLSLSTGVDKFLNDIKELTTRGKELNSLAKIISSSSEKIKEAEKASTATKPKSEDSSLVNESKVIALQKRVRDLMNGNILVTKEFRSELQGLYNSIQADSATKDNFESWNKWFNNIQKKISETGSLNKEVLKLKDELAKAESVKENKTGAYANELSKVNSLIKDISKNYSNIDNLDKYGVEVFEKELINVREILDKIKSDEYTLATPLERTNLANKIQSYLSKNTLGIDDSQKSILNGYISELNNIHSEKTKAELNEIANGFKAISGSLRGGSMSSEVSRLQKELNKLITYDNTNKTSEYVEGLKRLDSELKQLIQDFNSGKVSAEQFSKSFNSISNQKNLLTTDKKGTTLVGADKKAALYDDVNKYMKWNSKAMLAYRDELNGILNSIKATKTISELEKVKAEFYEIRTAARTAGLDGMTLLDGIITRAKSIGKTLISYFTVFDAFRYIREIGTVVTELDTAMTELKKVSDSTAVALENFSKKAFDIADNVGTTAQQLINSTADWQRLGESLSDAQKSAQTSNILLNVSEFENIDDATTSLVSMSQAYKDLEKIDIVDKLNVIGNNYSISTNELAASLQRSAATLTTAGNSLDEAIALTVAGNSITQDAEMVGAGLRTISLRIMGTEEAKKELEEMGESTDDYVVQTKSKLQSLIKDYTAVASNQFQGFDILTESGEYKSTYEILLGISKIYKEILDTDAEYGTNRGRALLEALAGKNRSNIAASVLQNPQLLEDVYKSSQEEYKGSAQHELDTYLDSVEGRLTQIKNKGQEISSDLISSDSIKVALDGFKGILTVVDAIVKNIGTIPLLLGSIGGIVGAKDNIGLFGATYDKYGMANGVGVTPKTKIGQKDFQDDIIKSYNNLTNEFNSGGIDRVKYQQEYNNLLSATNKETETLIKANKGLIISETSKAEAVRASGTAAKAASLGFKALAFAGNMLLGLGISAAISLIITGLDKLIVTSKEAKENFDSLQEDVKSGEQEVTRLNTEIATINEKISEIQSKGTITLSDQADLDRLISEREELESQLALQKKLNAAKRKEATNEVFDEFNPLTKEAKQKIESADSELKTKEEFNKVEYYGQGVSNSLSKQYKTYEEYVEAYKDRMEDLKNEILDEIPTIEAAIAQIESTNPNGKGLVGDKKDKYNELKDLLSKAYEKVYDNKEYYDIILKPVLSQEELKDFEKDFKNVVNSNGLELSDFLNEDGEADKSKMIKYFDSTVVDAFFESMQQNGVKVQDALSRMFDINSTEVGNRRNGNVSLGINGSTVELYSKGFENEYNQRKEIIKEEMSKFNDWSRDNPELKQFGEQIRNNTVRSMFGNVNMDDRVIINWTDELKKRYSEALKSWDYNPEVGSVDTVFGGSSSFDINGKEVEVAFTPVVNTNGEAEFLGATTLQTYIDNIIKEATKDGQWSVEEILALDKEGINNADVYDSAGKKIGETFIHGVIAGIGNSEGITPETIGMLMHFAGNYGSIGLANQGFSNYSNVIGNHIFGENPYNNISTNNETDNAYASQQRILFEKKKKEITEYVAKNFKPEQIKVLLGMDIPKKVLNMTEKEIKDWLNGLDLKVKIEDAEFSGKETFKNLDTVKSGLGSITDALGDYNKNGANIDPSKIFALKDMAGYKDFADILAEYPEDVDKVREAFNQLGTTYLDTSGLLDNLTFENKELYIQQLENMGVINAEEYAMSRLINTDKEATLELANLSENYDLVSARSINMNNLTYGNILALQKEATMAGVDATALVNYLAKKTLAAQGSLSTSASVQNLQNLCSALGIAVEELDNYQQALAGKNRSSRNLNTGSEMANYYAQQGMEQQARMATSNAIDRSAKIQMKFKDLSSNSSDTPRSGSPSTSNNAKQKKTKQKKELNLTRQLYDWIERRLDLLSKAVDRAKSKMERLLDWDKKKNATKKAIEAVRTELNATYKAAKRYFDYGKKIAKEEAKAAAKDAKKNGSKKQADKYGKNLTKKQIKDYTKLVEEGQIGKKDLQSIKDPRIKAFVDTLIQWNDKAKACLETADDLRDEMADLYETLANNPIDKCAEQVEKLSDKMTILEKKSSNMITKLGQGFTNLSAILSDSTNKGTYLGKDFFEGINELRDAKLENATKQLQSYADAYSETIVAYKTAQTEFTRSRALTGNYLSGMSASKLGLTKKQFDKLKGYVESGEEVPAELKNLIATVNTTAANKVGSYNEYFIKQEKMKEALDSAMSTYELQDEEHKALTRQILQEAFNNAKQGYDRLKTVWDDQINALASQVDLMEQYGMVLDRRNYDVQIDTEKERIELLKKEREELKAYLSTIPEGSAEWYESKDAVNALNEELSTATSKVMELQQKANAINRTIYELKTNVTKRISDEFAFISDLMEGVEDFNPVTHLATNEGYSRLFSYMVQMQNAKGEAQRAKEIVEELNNAIEKGVDEEGKIKLMINGAEFKGTLKEAQDELEYYYDQWRDQIKLTKEQENNLIEWEISKLEEEVSLAQELVDKRKDALTAEKNLHDYQRSIQDATTNINNLQKQITVLGGDNSQEGKARIQALQKQLKDAQQNLRETEYDRYISDQQDMLDNLMEEYTTLTDEEKLHREELLNRALADITLHTEEINSTMNDAMEKYGYKPETAQGILDWLKSAEVKEFATKVKDGLNETINGLGMNKLTLDGLLTNFNNAFGTGFSSALTTQLSGIASRAIESKISGLVSVNSEITELSNGEAVIDNHTSVKIRAGAEDTTNAGGTGDGNGYSGGAGGVKVSDNPTTPIFSNTTSPTESAKNSVTGAGNVPDVTIEDPVKKAGDEVASTSDGYIETILKNAGIQLKDPTKKFMKLSDLGILLGGTNDQGYSAVNQLIWANTGKVLATDDDFKLLADKLGVKYDNASESGALFNAIKNIPVFGSIYYNEWLKHLGSVSQIIQYLKTYGRVTNDSSGLGAVNTEFVKNYGVKLSDSSLKGIASWFFNINDYPKGWTGKDQPFYKKLKELGVFAKGGLVKAVKNRGEDGIAMVRDGEGILTPAQTKTFSYELAPRIDDIIDSSKIIKDATSNFNKLMPTGDTNVEATFQFDLENVTNASDIIKQIQSNNNVQNAIRSVTVDRIAGGSRLGVNMYR